MLYALLFYFSGYVNTHDYSDGFERKLMLTAYIQMENSYLAEGIKEALYRSGCFQAFFTNKCDISNCDVFFLDFNVFCTGLHPQYYGRKVFIFFRRNEFFLLPEHHDPMTYHFINSDESVHHIMHQLMSELKNTTCVNTQKRRVLNNDEKIVIRLFLNGWSSIYISKVIRRGGQSC